MVLNFLTVLVVVITFAGWGFLVPYGLSRLRFADRAVLGIPLIASVGMLANIFVPLDRHVAIATVGVGVGSFLWRIRDVRESLGEKPWASAGALVGLALVFGVGSGMSPLHLDSGLYHLQSIAWMEQSKIVFGIANIHDRLGFNSIWRVVGVMLDVPGVGRRGLLLPNAAMYVIVFGAFLQLALRSLWSNVQYPVSGLFATCVIVLFMGSAAHLSFDDVSMGPSYDSPTWLLSLFAFWRFLQIAESPATADPAEQTVNRLMVIVPTVLAVMIKVSTIPLLLLIPVALLYRSRDEKLGDRLALLRSRVVLAVTCTGALWLTTGIISSGCFVFPAASTCMPALPWGVPRAMAQFQADSITAWARSPNADFMRSLNNWRWLAAWPHTMLAARPFVPTVYRTLAVLVAVIVGCRLIDLRAAASDQRARPTSLWRPVLYAVSVTLACAAFWFVKAPDPRFGLGFLFATPALVFAWLGAGARPAGVARFFASGLGQSAILAVLSIWVIGSNWSRIPPSYPMQWTIPIPQLAHRPMGAEIDMAMPVGSAFCWDAPPPCTPIANERLLHGRFGIWRYYATGPDDQIAR